MMLNGIDLLARAVKVTLGPGGRNVIIERPGMTPMVANSGVVVARSIALREPFADMGARLLCEAAARTSEVAGDGTTTATTLAHAIVDALLIAAGLGDIGGMVGIDDPQYAGASGEVFVREAVRRLADAGFQPVNVTAQIIGNRPRFSGRRTEAEGVLSEWVGAPVTLGATTTDGLGLTGEGRGIAVVATALITDAP
jgi:2-C-methyl-D-erythritol 2,4-cyclodiphosphate synthase